MLNKKWWPVVLMEAGHFVFTKQEVRQVWTTVNVHVSWENKPRVLD